MVAMGTKEDLIDELDDASQSVLEEVLRYVRVLKAGAEADVAEAALLSESALARDWLGPEEDEAWAHL